MLQGCWAALLIIPLKGETQMKQKDDKKTTNMGTSHKPEDAVEIYTINGATAQSEAIQNSYMIESRISTVGEPQNTKTVVEISRKEGIEDGEWTLDKQSVKYPRSDEAKLDKENSAEGDQMTNTARCACCPKFISESKAIFTDRNFQLASASMVFLVFSMSVGLTHMVSYSEEEGYSKSFGNTLLTITGIASLGEYFLPSCYRSPSVGDHVSESDSQSPQHFSLGYP